MKFSKGLKLILATVMMMVLSAVMAVTAFAATKATDVSSAAQLEKALKKETGQIRVVKSFTVDRTFYVTGKTTIYADKAVTLTRDVNFAGDIFVVGEDSQGESALLDGANASLTFGKKSGKKGSMLTIDGNRSNMKVKVKGSVVFITNSSIVNVYSNVAMNNSYKKGNTKVLESRYLISSADRVGGAVFINTSGSLNIYGGTFKNNAVNDEKINKKDSSKSVYTSTRGGVIYNYSNVNISGGTFESNKAANGGVIFNHETLEITKASFLSNKATANGGAIYQHSTQKCSTCIGVQGDEKGSTVLFKGNTATDNGGAIHAGSHGNIVIFGRTTFTSNKASDNGGAISSYTACIAYNTIFNKNTASDRGGAVYAAYSNKEVVARVCTFENCEFTSNNSVMGGAAALGSTDTSLKYGGKINFKNCKFTSNKATSKKKPESAMGGAIYLYRKSVVNVDDSSFSKNTAISGGAIYSIGSSKVTVTDSSFSSNSVKGSGISAGAVYAKESTLVLDVVKLSKNKSTGDAGAVGVYSCSSVTLNKLTATGNTSGGVGAVLYNSGSTVKVYSSTFESNTSKTSGGAVAIYNKGTTSIYKSKFTSNTATSYGGAVMIYSGKSTNTIQDCTFTKNSSTKGGGALYISKTTTVKLYKNKMTENSSSTGGAICINSSNPKVTINGLTVSKNTAKKGKIIYGKSSKSSLSIKKSSYKDSEVKKLTKSYWSKAIVGNIKVTDETGKVPSYSTYKRNSTKKVKAKSNPSVKTIINLGKKSDQGDINSKYAALPKLDNSSNFMSRNTTYFKNINKKTVAVDTFVYRKGEKANNCTFGEGMLIYQAILYKQANPKENVSIDVSAYRISIEAAININRNSRYFGYMRNLVGKEYDKYGFVRISYLLVTAARMGIKVNVITQLDGYPISKKDPTFAEYFKGHMNDACDKAYVKDGVVGDYLNAVFSKWSLGTHGATDMEHVKVCAVSHYLDMNGKAHKNAVWSSSTNLDGIKDTAVNGNSKLQTATIISDHAKIYQISKNYIGLMMKYGEVQDDVYIFRNIIRARNTEQIKLIRAGKESEIPKDEQIVYLGSETDSVFEFYYAPFGGDVNVWDEVNNPYCKYIRKAHQSEGSVIIAWNNANHSHSWHLSRQIFELFYDVLDNTRSPENKVFLNMKGISNNWLDGFEVGVDIGYKSINYKPYGKIHNKDLQLSYVENGKRKYVSILNSLNFHSGALYYQTNNLLVVKESNMNPGSVFHTVAKYSTAGIV